MRLSLIVTTFKRPELLARALRSVLAQLDGSLQIELIVADDDPEGSGLRGVQASGAANAAGVRLSLVRRTDGPGGVAASRNRAIAASRGDWLMFLDDDDTLREGALRALFARAQETGADFVCGRHVHVHEHDDTDAPLELEPPHVWTDPDRLLVRNVLPMGAFMLRRSVARVPFNTVLQTHEDWLFLIDNLVAAHPRPRVASIDRVVLAVHQALDGSRSHRNAARGLRQRAADFARIYAMHPAPHLAAQRRRRLAQLPSVDLDGLITGLIRDPGPVVSSVVQGRFLVEADAPVLQQGLPDFGEAVTEAARLAYQALKHRPGRLIEVGAGKGALAVPLARAFPDCSLLCVEAARSTYMHLCANLTINLLDNVDPYRARVGARDAEASLACPEITLDRLAGTTPTTVLRVGTASDTRAILEGAGRLLAEQRPLLILASPEPHGAALEPLLTQCGYALRRFAHNLVGWDPGDESAEAFARALPQPARAQPSAPGRT